MEADGQGGQQDELPAEAERGEAERWTSDEYSDDASARTVGAGEPSVQPSLQPH